ncbi:MAG: EAL domain-containing protein [Lachnospiraceae bacterium]|nr:EAL domain-containing protein [Lachnospiraceae bacterium]
MLKTLRRLLGLEKLTKYEHNYLQDMNIKTAVYMASIVILLEVWMIIRFLTMYAIPREYTMQKTMAGLKNYFILLATGLILFIFTFLYRKHSQKLRTAGNFVIIAFAGICVYFGIIVSVSDVTGGKQILCFLTMIMFAGCLLIWKPYISILMLTVCIYWFGYKWSLAVVPEEDPVVNDLYYFFHWMNPELNKYMMKGDVVNLITYWISLIFISISIYMQRVTEAKKDERLEIANEELHEKYITDSLTGIRNMSYFANEAEKIMKSPDFILSEAIFLFIDIEDFKNYNEKYGFHEGNEFIKKCAKLLANCFEGDLFARYSDDHFVVLGSTKTALQRLEDLRKRVSILENEITLDMKAGGLIPKYALDPRSACDYARHACNSIKHRKDVFFRLYDDEMYTRFKNKQYVINNLEKAVNEGYIKAYYQPLVWAEDGTLCGLEALARWVDPKIGFLSPGDFIPVLEEHKEIQILDECVIELVCRDISERLSAGRPMVPVSLNFSRVDFETGEVVDTFESTVRKYKIPKQYVHVEITESALTEQLGSLEKNMVRLRESGYSVWLDDFGSGYSSLNSLKDYSFDVMKIDMLFLKNFEKSSKAKPILENVVKLADSIGMQTVSEGVETEEQAQFLKSIGCGRLQGYYFGKPMTIEEFDVAMASGKYKISDHFEVL